MGVSCSVRFSDRRGARARLCAALTVLVSLAIALLAPPASAMAAGCAVDSHTQEVIRNYVAKNAIDIDALLSSSPTYTASPVYAVAPYEAGKLSSTTSSNALAMLNLARFVAGIPADVTLSDHYGELAQAASLVNRVNNTLSHYPTQPAGMSDALYKLGSEGAAASNISMGRRNPAACVLEGYLPDSSSSNISTLGHRRWVLNPSMRQTGFGQVDRYSAMYAHDTANSSASSSYYNVAWPAQNMPIEMFHDNDPWSLSTNRTESKGSVRVTLTRVGDGRVWRFSSGSSDGYFNVNNEGYGQTGCIIFRPSNVTYSAGDSFKVKIEGASAGTIEYTVNFFSVYPKAAQTITTSASSFTKTYGDADFSLGASALGGARLSYSSDGDVVRITSDGTATIVRAGTTQVTIHAAETSTYAAASKTVTVTVNKASVTVTADDQVGFVGKELPKLTATVTGRQGADPVRYALSCAATGAEQGTFPIVVSLGDNPNYNVTAKNGTLTVSNKKQQVITCADAITKTYGDADFSLGASVLGGATLRYATDDSSVATVYTDGTVTIAGAGSTTITITADETDEYAPATKTVALTVGRAKVTVAADDKTVEAGKGLPQLTATVTGDAGKGGLSYSLSTDARDEVGTYVITVTASPEDNPNYEVTTINGTLTVVEKLEDLTCGFPDVGAGDWYAKSGVLAYVIDHGLMGGNTDGTFAPFRDITRGEVATILHNMAGRPAASSASFSDVDYGRFYGDAIRWARATGVISGSDNKFRPNDTVSRQELCVMIANYAKYVGGVEIWSDSYRLDKIAGAYEVASWARQSVAWCVDRGIISGVVDTSTGTAWVMPAGGAQRCAAAKMVSVLHEEVLGLS